MILIFALLSLGYVHGWLRLRCRSTQTISAWRAASFIFGVFLLWGALGSSLVAYAHHLLTGHMIQHLLLMTVAPAFVLLGNPLRALWYALPRSGRVVLGGLLQAPVVKHSGMILSTPAVGWTVAALTLVVWHVPAVLTLGLHSEMWHAVEQSSFLSAGFLFWWPVVQPWPSTLERTAMGDPPVSFPCDAAV